MENSYGIGIANRYELFYVDDEAGDPSDKILNKKAKQQKKGAAPNAVASSGTNLNLFYLALIPLINSCMCSH